MAPLASQISLDRMVNAVEKVRRRLLKATATLQTAKVAYAVAGGNAVAAWVSTIDEEAVRNTRDVDILIRRSDLPAAKSALEAVGFIYRHAAGMDLFLDGSEGSPRSGVHILFANEKVHADEPAANPDVAESSFTGTFQVLTLEALVRIKLTAFRDKDRTHLRDLLDVGLIDAQWAARLPDELGKRLLGLLNNPRG